MIQKIKLLHYLSENTYKKICAKLNFDWNSAKSNVAVFNGEKISKIELYNIEYKEYGHIWFMDVLVCFPKFECEYKEFGQNLYNYYYTIFGEDIMLDFPQYNELCCGYVEYSSILELGNNAADIISRLREMCVPEQLDKALWDNYKKPHGTIEFCMSINENTLETLARCHGTALKKRVTEVTSHKTVGLIPEVAINKDTETRIMDWLYKRYHIPYV